MKLLVRYIFSILIISFCISEVLLRLLGGVGKPFEAVVKDGFFYNKINTDGLSVYGTFPVLIKKKYKINNEGYNSSKDYLEIDDYSKMIGLVGDSFIEGYHVDVENSIGRLIEEKCDSIFVEEYGIGGHNIHNYIESYNNNNMHLYKKVYFFIHITDFLKDVSYKSKYNRFKEKYFRPLYEASFLLQFINKNHKPFAREKKMNKQISKFTKSKVLRFLEQSKNVSFIYRDANVSDELDFIKEQIEIVDHRIKPFDYGFDQHWNDNGRQNIAIHILNNLGLIRCQNF